MREAARTRRNRTVGRLNLNTDHPAGATLAGRRAKRTIRDDFERRISQGTVVDLRVPRHVIAKTLKCAACERFIALGAQMTCGSCGTRYREAQGRHVAFYVPTATRRSRS
jgi:hypothetical protein